MIAVFAAMDAEMAALERRLAAREHEAIGGQRAVRGRCAGAELLACRTGLGERARAVAAAVLDATRPDIVLSTGVAGALDPDLSAGDVVLCETVVSGPGPQAPAVRSDVRLLEAATASDAGIRVRRGRSLTVDAIVGEPAAKAKLRLATGADVVEMESYWVGLAARERGLPFLAVRVVLDTAADMLPELPGFVAPDGTQRAWAVLPYLITHPQRLSLLLRLGRSNRLALRAMGLFAEAFAGAAAALSVADARPA
jgi:adenosylhomocysteine nucleosidase